MKRKPKVPQKKQQSILMEAENIVHGARREFYGHPLDNHGLTADFWNLYLVQKYQGSKLAISGEDVCLLNVLQKIARCATTGKITRDTIVDLAGYAANVEMIVDERDRRARWVEKLTPKGDTNERKAIRRKTKAS